MSGLTNIIPEPQNVISTKWVAVKMLKDFSGAISGIHCIRFEKGFSYQIDEALAKIFFEQHVAVVQKNSKTKPLVLKVDQFGCRMVEPE